MPKARLTYDGDGDYIEKDRRILQLTQEIQDKVDAIPWVVDDLTGTSSTDALSANMGRVLQEQINELSALWHFLSGWNASTWLPATNPRVDPYYYKTWDYYRVTAIWETNYKPHWWTYNQWVASTAVELDEVSIWDWYMYDGGVRILIKQWWSWWGGAYFKTQAEYDALPTSKESDGNLYVIVDTHINLISFEELTQLTPAPDAILAELNKAPKDYAEYDYENGDIWGRETPSSALPRDDAYLKSYAFLNEDINYQLADTNLTEQELINIWIPQDKIEEILAWEWFYIRNSIE